MVATIFSHPTVVRSKNVYRLISKIKNIDKRNLIRGYASKERIFGVDAINIRKGATENDSALIGALLKADDGLGMRDLQHKPNCSDIFRLTSLSPVSLRSEVAYTSGYINAVGDKAISALKLMRKLIDLPSMSSSDALNLLTEAAAKYGASNYLSYKLAYLRSTRDISSLDRDLISKIEDEIGHRDSPGMHFSAMENMSPRVSLFTVAQRRINGLASQVKGECRKSLALNNFVPTPLSLEDVPGFLLRATESSMLDTLYAIQIIINLSERFEVVLQIFEKWMLPALWCEFLEVKKTGEANKCEISTKYYDSQECENDRSLNIYKLSSAFLEIPRLTKFRNDLDQTVGARLLAEILGDKTLGLAPVLNNKEVLLGAKDIVIDSDLNIKLDTFCRTHQFLKFITEQFNLQKLNKGEIKFILENTVGLDNLLTESEIRALYNTAPRESKKFFAVLALAMLRSKSIDPDVDFEFRSDFISHVKKDYNGSIESFINDLLEDSPEIAIYIVNSLDEVTLEKMYTLVRNASEASEIRSRILQAIGKRLNKIEYIIEADGITTRSKVAKLQQYFDGSRMYVDSIALKKWLDSNPNISTEQYRAIYPQLEIEQKNSLKEQCISEGKKIELGKQSEYLINQIAKEAFEQFCLNTEFGIESYLGRRIRHNTLDGVTTDSVDAVLRKEEYAVLMSNANMRRAIDAWIVSYKGLIDKFRRDQLQFKSSQSLFNAKLDLNDSTTKKNILELFAQAGSAAGSDLFNDLIIAFCWRQIAPQLEHAARVIKTSLLQDANCTIDKHFAGFNAILEIQMKSELLEAVNEVLKKVADWFQIPQTGFVSASVRELCQIILLELNRKNQIEYIGIAIDNKYTGISVHRMYDCLASLLKNAHKHGEDGTKIIVNAGIGQCTASTIFERASIEVTSTVEASKYTSSKERINSAIRAAESGSDMVTEGYTGIKKVKFITRLNEGGEHTVRLSYSDELRQLTVGFSLLSEIASENSSTSAGGS